MKNNDLSYDLYAKDFLQINEIRKFTDHIVREVQANSRWDTHSQITIESKEKGTVLVSMTVFGLGEPIVVQKEGKQTISVLRKVRKVLLRQVRRQSKKNQEYRRKTLVREQHAS